jgi:hypothetical protein
MNVEHPDPLLIRAEAAWRSALADPRAGRRDAEAVAADARAAAAAEALVIALRAAGWAARELHDHGAARRHLDEAVQVSARAELRDRHCDVLITRSALHLEQGRTGAARADLVAARALAYPAALAELAFAEGLLERKTGDFVAAARAYQRATGDAAPGRPEVRVKALNNLALVEVRIGRYARAEQHLRTAATLAETYSPAAAAIVAHNLAGVAADRGDPVEALRRYGVAEERLSAAGLPLAEHHLDKSKALLALRLLDEAADAAAQAVAAFESQDATSMLAEALMPAARIAVERKRYADAASAAARAEELFARQQRPGWRASAELLLITAQAAHSAPGMRDVERLGRIERTMARNGDVPAAMEAALLAGQLAHALGRSRLATAAFDRVARAAADGPILMRLQGRLAAASGAELRGDARRLGHLCHQGLVELTAYRATFASSELRARAAGHGVALAELGLRAARRAGHAERVWTWIERGRAAVQVGRDTVALDDRAQPLLAELRSCERQAEELTALAGAAGAEPWSSDDDALGSRVASRAELLRRVAVLEHRIRAVTWTGRGHRAEQAGVSVRTLRALRRQLGSRTLLQYGELDGRLLGVAVRESQVVLRDLAPASEVRAAGRQLTFALRRLGQPRSPASVAAARASADAELRRLDAWLIGPFGALVDAADEVIVAPPGPLVGLPWSVLPSVVDRPVRVVPSALSWLRTAGRTPGSDRVVLAAGPDLAAAVDEIEHIAPLHGPAPVQVLRQATCTALREAAAGARLVHVACHGRLRGDSPTFSALRLHDGPLTVHDLEHLPAPVHHWILASCDLGGLGELAGPELEGVLAALLEGGAGAVLAAVASIPDAATAQLMVPLHAALASGHSLPESLRRARAALDTTDPVAFAVATAFSCYGGG